MTETPVPTDPKPTGAGRWPRYVQWPVLLIASVALVVPLEEILWAGFGRTLLLNTAQMESGIELARRHQLLSCEGKNVRLLFAERSTLVETLLNKAM